MNTVIPLIIGFVLGLLSWWIQQAWQRDKIRKSVRMALRLEYDHNLTILNEFWNSVNHGFDDQHPIERYHRLATQPLLGWTRTMWSASAARLAEALGEEEVRRAFALNDHLDDVARLQQFVRAAFDTDKGREAWITYSVWKQHRVSDDVHARQAATNEAREVTRRCGAFTDPIVLTWNELSEVYNAIKQLGNPIGPT